MILSEQIINGRRFRIIVQKWYGMEWGSANARDEAVRKMVRDTAVQMMLVMGEATIREVLNQQAESGYQHRVLEDSIYAESQKRIAAEKERDHWRQARQDAMAAGELMKAEIDSLRQQLAGAHAPAMAQQSEEIAYLRARLDEERSVIASLRQQLESALALLTGQRLNAEEQDREIERLRKFADGVRTQIMRYTMSWASWNEMKSALAELDAQPAPVAEAEGGT